MLENALYIEIPQVHRWTKTPDLTQQDPEPDSSTSFQTFRENPELWCNVLQPHPTVPYSSKQCLRFATKYVEIITDYKAGEMLGTLIFYPLPCCIC